LKLPTREKHEPEYRYKKERNPMPARNELNIRAAAVGLDNTTIANDSKLEQKILFLEKRQSTITGTAATTTLTTTGTATNGETITFTDMAGSRVYTLKTALTEVAASGTLTSTGTIPNDGDSVSIGAYTYVFKTTLDTGTAFAQLLAAPSYSEVLINASAANALANLKKAINASGIAGTDYTSNVIAHPLVTGGTLTTTTLLVTAKQTGSDNYRGVTISTGVSKSATTLSWGTGSLVGGVDPVANEILIGAAATNTLDNIKDAINSTSVSGGPGSTYSSNTKRISIVTAGTKTATTLVIAATDTNLLGTALGTTETMANASFTGSTLSAGTLGSLASSGSTTAGARGVSGDKNVTL
jgi:hypothetical protein